MAKSSSTVLILLGIFCGIVLGVILKCFTAQPWTDRHLMYLQFPGEIFLRVVNCLILPLVISSIVSASCNLSKSGRIGITALLYYIVTTSLGILLCVVLAETIRPGEWRRTYSTDGPLPANVSDVKPMIEFDIPSDTLLDLMRNLLPENLIQACLQQYQTIFQEVDPMQTQASLVKDLPVLYRYTPGTNVLGLVFFGLVFGLTLGTMKDDLKKPLLDFFQCLAAATATLTDWVIMSAPVAVIFLIAGKILKTEESLTTLERLGIFILTVLTGLAIHALVILPVLYFICTRRSPFKILIKMGPALVTACGTSSSTATVPTTIRCLDKIGIDRRVSRFVAPIGATINMDGIALYETIGALFIIQMRGLRLSIAETIAVSITCTLSCIGAAGLPSGGYAMLIMVLNSLGIPAEDVTLIIAVDSFVDRFRTMVNIVADSLGAGLINDLSKKNQQGLCCSL